MRAPFQIVRARLQEWEKLGASPSLVRQIHFGVRIPWAVDTWKMIKGLRERLRARGGGIRGRGSQSLGYEQVCERQEFIRSAISSGHQWRIHRPRSQGPCGHRLQTREYKHQRHPFRMEFLLDLAPQLRKDNFLFKADLQVGYYHIGISAHDRPFLTFKIGRRFFIPLSLKYGLKTAPFIFTKFLRPLIWEFRRLGYRGIIYLVDIGGAPRAVSARHVASPGDAEVPAKEIQQSAFESGDNTISAQDRLYGIKNFGALGNSGEHAR